MKRIFILIFVLIPGFSLTSYPQAQPPAPAAPQEEPPPVLSVPKDYRYNSRSRRDPFVNPVPKPIAQAPPIPSVRPPGLKGVLVAEASISGVVTSREPQMNVVIIGAPGNKTYFAHVGDALFDAVIKEIKLDTVTFALTAPGGRVNEATPREIVRKVRPTTGDAK
jgi:hypothetical protein